MRGSKAKRIRREVERRYRDRKGGLAPSGRTYSWLQLGRKLKGRKRGWGSTIVADERRQYYQWAKKVTSRGPR